MSIHEQIFGILFYLTEPVTVQELARILEVEVDEVVTGLRILKESLSDRGVQLLSTSDTYMLTTAPALSDVVVKIRKENLTQGIGRAGAETLAIILYHGKVSRARIDEIRGVHSGMIMRQLLTRGLVERVAGEGRSPLYQPTARLYEHLGITDRSELIEFDACMQALEAYTQESNE